MHATGPLAHWQGTPAEEEQIILYESRLLSPLPCLIPREAPPPHGSNHMAQNTHFHSLTTPLYNCCSLRGHSRKDPFASTVFSKIPRPCAEQKHALAARCPSGAPKKLDPPMGDLGMQGMLSDPLLSA